MMSEKVTILYRRLLSHGDISLEVRVSNLFDIADFLLYIGGQKLNLIEEAVFAYAVRKCAFRSSLYL